jgi:predicted esterase
MNAVTDPHANIRILYAGESLQTARAVMILLHGRGGSSESMLSLANDLYHDGFAIIAPQANDYSWYPHRFVRPVEENEPYLSSALNALVKIVADVREARIPSGNIVFGGFSQGACLALEYVARFPDMYGGVLGFSGGLIGAEDEPLTVPHDGQPLAGTPVFLGCAKRDAHIPAKRVEESAAIFEQMGAVVTVKLYPGSDHTINDDELAHARQIIAAIQ